MREKPFEPIDDRWAAVLPPETDKKHGEASLKPGTKSGLVKLPDLAGDLSGFEKPGDIEDLTEFATEVAPKPGDEGTRTAEVLAEIAKEAATKKAREDSWAA